MKKHTVLLTGIFCMFFAFHLQADARGGEYTYKLYEYNILEDGTVEIANYVGTTTGKVKIPAKINGKKVTKIGRMAFSALEFSQVVIPKYVKTIDFRAFANNDNLKTITIPGSVKRIGASAFSRCTKLKKITILTRKLKAGLIGDDAFQRIQKKAVFYLPAGKRKAYKKILLQRGATRKMKFYTY